MGIPSHDDYTKFGKRCLRRSESGGQPVFNTEGPMREVLYRCRGLTPAEREYRKQWLREQLLKETEPVVLHKEYELLYNPIKRFIRYPLDKLFLATVPYIGQAQAESYRWYTGKFGLGLLVVWSLQYIWKYRGNDWERRSFYQVRSREEIAPNSSLYPHNPVSKGEDFNPKIFNEDYKRVFA